MIELSKCPSCAADDRVTIAGKDFCMRCGTPMEDNAKMGVVGDSQAQPQVVADINQSPNPGVVNSVQKFNEHADASVMLHSKQPNMPTVQNNEVGVFYPPPRMEQTQASNDYGNNASALAAVPLQNTQSVPSAASVASFEAMTLDKKAGVLSDDQFDQLNKSVSSSNSITPESISAHTEVPMNHEPIVAMTQAPEVPAQPANASANGIAMSTDLHPTGSNLHNTVGATQSTVGDMPEHKEKTSKKAKKVLKPAAIAVSIAALFATGAYIWKVNYPSLAFKIASAKAGMSATMPGYVPTGYNLGSQIQTNPGTVSYNLINSSADKKITVTQSKTDWDSQALAENYVSPKAENYLALQAQGLTIYVLGQNQATWVNKGTWYKLDSPNQPLNQDQIIKIATSL
jgi:hypothetical protein